MKLKITYGKIGYLNKIEKGNAKIYRLTKGVSIEEACEKVSQIANLAECDYIIDTGFKSPYEVIKFIKELYDINYLNKHIPIEIINFIGNNKYDTINLKRIKKAIKHHNIRVVNYKIHQNSVPRKWLSKNPIIISKHWNTGGEMFTNEGIITIRKQEPKEFIELKQVLQKLDVDTEMLYKHLMSKTVSLVNDCDENSEGYRNYSFYRVYRSDIEKELERLNMLKPLKRRYKMNNFLNNK